MHKLLLIGESGVPVLQEYEDGPVPLGHVR